MTDIRKLSILDPHTGNVITSFGSSNIARMAIHTGSELGEMENGLTLLLFPRDVVPASDAASMGTIDQPGNSALQAVSFNSSLTSGLYSTQIIGLGNGQRMGSTSTYPAIFINPDSTVGGDSGAPLIVNGSVVGINNGNGGSRGLVGRITDDGLLKALIANYSP